MGLSEQANLPYLNVTLDVGAAMNAYKFIWNYHDQYKNVCIHLGMFHFMKENFKVILFFTLSHIVPSMLISSFFFIFPSCLLYHEFDIFISYY